MDDADGPPDQPARGGGEEQGEQEVQEPAATRRPHRPALDPTPNLPKAFTRGTTLIGGVIYRFIHPAPTTVGMPLSWSTIRNG